jgi:hypothetical protein
VAEAQEEEADLQEQEMVEELPLTSSLRADAPKTIDPVRVFRSAVRIA